MNSIPVIILTVVLFLLSPVYSFAHSAKEIDKALLREEIIADLKENILPFWMDHTVDPEGGFYGGVAFDGTPSPNEKKGVVLNARILWTFSTAYRLFHESRYLEMANRAQAYLLEHFMDTQYGGVFWSLDPNGEPADTDKQAYGISFAIYGLSEHYRATGERSSLDAAIALFNIMEKRLKDPQEGGYIDSATRDWKRPQRYGYDGKGIAPKTMNTHIHVLEAYTSLYRVWKEPALEQSLRELIDISIHKMYQPANGHLALYFDRHWHSLEDIDSYGHDIETSWLMAEAAEVIGDKSLTQTVKKVAIHLAKTALQEGLTSDGAMTYERNGNHYQRELSWWCQAETVVGCVNAWQLTGESSYLATAHTCWEWIKEHMIDHQYGEWYGSVSPDNQPDKHYPKASMWRCPYHNSRMGFEIFERLK